jgi:hypothetical protein
MKTLLLAAALALVCAGSTWASGARPFYGEAVLATPVAAPKETNLDGVVWRCEQEKCIGTADVWSTLDSHVKECRKVAAMLGTLTSYRSRGRTISTSQIANCNRPLT